MNLRTVSAASLKMSVEVMGERDIVVTRELTKKFEEIFRGNVSEALAKFRETEPRGEFTILIAEKRRKNDS